MSNIFDAIRNGTGTGEWAEVNENIVRGCSNGCLYCYAAHNANRFNLRKREDWAFEEFTKRSKMTSYPAKDGVIMFPTAHDITPFSVETYLRVVKLMLFAGNKVLIVSKPNYSCINRLVDELTAYKDQILFRFTIGTMLDDVSKYWEPGAPLPAERVSALKLAYERGYRTSVSAEPLLGGLCTAEGILAATRDFITETIWIGKLNKPRTRVVMDDPIHLENVIKVESMQTDEAIIHMYEMLKDDPKIRWKDSIKEALAKNGVTNVVN